jgi:hypothetical protein
MSVVAKLRELLFGDNREIDRHCTFGDVKPGEFWSHTYDDTGPDNVIWLKLDGVNDHHLTGWGDRMGAPEENRGLSVGIVRRGATIAHTRNTSEAIVWKVDLKP